MMGYNGSNGSNNDSNDHNETILSEIDPHPPHPDYHPPVPPDNPYNPEMYGNHTYTYQGTVAGEMLWLFLFICMVRCTFEMYLVCKDISKNVSTHYRKKRIKRVRLTETDIQENLLNQCSICLEDFVVGESANILTCSHGFHEACLKEWLPRNLTCPICRQPIGDRSTDNLRSGITDEENS